MLQCSWEDENDLKRGDFENCKQEYEKRKEEIEKNLSGLFPGKKLLEVLQTENVGGLRPIDCTCLLDFKSQQENEDDQDGGTPRSITNRTVASI